VIQVTLNFDTQAEMLAFFAGQTAVAETPKKPRKAAEAPAPTPTAPVMATPAPTPEPAPAEIVVASPSKAITLEEVRARLAALSQGGKTQEVKALIGSFGVGKLTDLKVDQYAAVLEKAEAL
jgi:hypothetical protein